MTMYASWRDVPKGSWRWKNFSPRELACKGTGSLLVDEDALNKLQALRDRLGVPMIVTSAYRSPQHNRSVGGASRSKHMEGIAFDIRMENHNPSAFIAAAQAEGFNAIGTYPRSGFVHIDTRPGAARWGDPFPQGDTNLPPEAPRRPEKLTEDRDAQIAGGIGAVAAANEVIRTAEDGAGLLERLSSVSPLLLLIVAGIGFLIWRHKSGRPL